MLETAFQGVNAVIGGVSNLFKGDDEPPAAEYIAEGARDVRIDQPAARSGARCTCKARVVDGPGNGAFCHRMCAFGGIMLMGYATKKLAGEQRWRPSLMFIGKGKCFKITCFVASIGMSMLTQKATSALPHPVNAATRGQIPGR